MSYDYANNNWKQIHSMVRIKKKKLPAPNLDRCGKLPRGPGMVGAEVRFERRPLSWPVLVSIGKW